MTYAEVFSRVSHKCTERIVYSFSAVFPSFIGIFRHFSQTGSCCGVEREDTSLEARELL